MYWTCLRIWPSSFFLCNHYTNSAITQWRTYGIPTHVFFSGTIIIRHLWQISFHHFRFLHPSGTKKTMTLSLLLLLCSSMSSRPREKSCYPPTCKTLHRQFIVSIFTMHHSFVFVFSTNAFCWFRFNGSLLSYFYLTLHACPRRKSLKAITNCMAWWIYKSMLLE